MADETAGTATAPAPPTGEPGPGATPPGQPERPTEPQGLQSKRDARHFMAERVRAAAEKVAEPKPGEPTPASGEPKPGEAKPGESIEPKPGEAKPAEAKPGEAAGEQPEAKPAEAAVKVEIAADHPIANGKAESITVASENEARLLRGLINATGVRVREAQQLRTRAQDAEHRVVDAEQRLARLQATVDAKTTWEGTPEHKKAREVADAIAAEHGQEAADRYLAGERAKLEEQIDVAYKAREGEINAEAEQRNADAWAREAYQRLETLPRVILDQPKFTDWYRQALASFNSELKLGHVQDEVGQPVRDIEGLHKAFRLFFEGYVVRRPEVLKAHREMKERQEREAKEKVGREAAEQQRIVEIKRQAVEEHTRSLQANRQANPPHPLGAIPSAARPPVPNGSGAELEDSASLTPGQLKRAARNATMDRIRERFGG